MVSRKITDAGGVSGRRLGLAPRGGASKARGKATGFVRPGDLARYVDNHRHPPAHHHLRIATAKAMGRASQNHGGNARAKTQAAARSGGRSAGALQLQAQRATVPTPRGVAAILRREAPRAKPAAPSRLARARSPRLASLPHDILTRVLCCMSHHDMKPIKAVCSALADAAKTAVATHFNFLTPRSHAGGARPGRPFGSSGGPTPRAPRRVRHVRHTQPQRKSRRLAKQRKKALAARFDAMAQSASSSGSGFGSGDE